MTHHMPVAASLIAGAQKVKARTVVVESYSPYKAIITTAKKEKCDLIVMASHGRSGASAVLLRNLLIYGLGGVIIPFVGIKLIDVAIVTVGLV